MNLVVTTGLALAGTTLTAVAVFAPFHKRAFKRTPVRVAWPTLIDASARDCNELTRIQLADALGRLESAWATATLREAYRTEPDYVVRSAIGVALRTTSAQTTQATRATLASRQPQNSPQRLSPTPK